MILSECFKGGEPSFEAVNKDIPHVERREPTRECSKGRMTGEVTGGREIGVMRGRFQIKIH
jgi:hypothetical protein